MKFLGLGERIRRLREQKGMAPADLARLSGLDEKRLLAIESNQNQPLIADLIQLSKVLGVNVADIFRERPPSKNFEILRRGERPQVKPLLEPRKTKIFDYQYEFLSEPAEDKHMEAYLIEVPPHQSKPPRHDVTHAGEEFIYVLEGVLEGEVAGESFRLSAGDSMYLRSTLPHVFFNPFEQTARALTVIYPF